MATGYRPEWVQGAFVDFIESHLSVLVIEHAQDTTVSTASTE